MVAEPAPATEWTRVELPWRGDDRRGDPLVVRLGTRKDAARYAELMATLVTETDYMLQGPDDPLPTVSEYRDILEAYHRRDNCVCIVAARPSPRERPAMGFGLAPTRQRLVGAVTLAGGRAARVRHCAELAMGVRRQGWNAGIGGLLLDAALTWAAASDRVARVALAVFADNGAARALYRRRGFGEEGILRRYVRRAGGYADLIGMGRWVAP